MSNPATARPVGPVPPDVLYRALEQALRAPSVHNTQPWRWRIGEDAAELHADWNRHLVGTDPDRRDLVISCGAALDHLRVALARLGWGASTERLPDPENPAHLATVRPGHKRVDRRDVGLAVAIERRRTDRRRLSARPVPSDIVASLVGQAARHRTRLHPVAEEQARDRLVAALAEAARRQQYTPGYPAELAIWTRRCTAAHDGIPRASVPDAGADQDSPGLRRFPRGRLFAHPRRLEPDAEAATFMVVTTAGDGVVDQLRAGEATSAVLLAATRIGLACTPLSQAVEVGYTRRQLAEQILHVSGHPQLIIRIGWAQEGAAELPATPRRPLAFVLMPG